MNDDYKDDPSSYNEHDVALRFAERYAGHLRYVAEWKRNKWLVCDAHGAWRKDTTLYVFDLVRKHCCEEYARSENQAVHLLRLKTYNAVEWLARSDRRLATQESELEIGGLEEDFETTTYYRRKKRSRKS